MSIPNIDQLNQFPREDFFKVINLLFETAPPLADKLYDGRPYQSYESLISFGEDLLNSESGAFTETEKIEIINAHPRIGAPKENLSAQSYIEQGYNKPGGLTTEDDAVNAKLFELNNLYESKYGFKFVVFVAGRPRKEIVKVLEDRLNKGTATEELEIGLTDMMLIARDRLKKFTVNS
ncbi:hypothetical protein HK098_002659 [Nowakowskiella sp. JEL0407]|nr:hypothetical protein HK098_002659 [Nowakowskiella sp. JEL0407]